MLGRKDYTQEELDHAKTAVEAFEPLFLNNMTLVLDRYFVHRIRVVSRKDGNPLNEVELSVAEFERLSKAFFAEVEARFR